MDLRLTPPEPDDDALRDLPEGLRASIRREFGRAIAPPSDLDQRVLNDARRRLAFRRRPWRPVAAGLAAAAAIAIVGVVLIGSPTGQRPSSVAIRDEAIPNDLNADGRIDILDALTLAISIDTNAASADVTGDGAVDQSDVDALARRVVALGGHG